MVVDRAAGLLRAGARWLLVGFGGNQAQATLPEGTHAFYVHLAAGSGKEVTVTQLSPAPSPCLTGVTVGTW